MPDDNGQVPVLNPADAEAWIRHVSNRIAKGVKIVTDAEAEMKAKKRAYDLAFAYAYKKAEGPEQFRKQTATIEAMPHREEADNAEIAYRYAQRTAEALERELFAAMAINRNIISMYGAAGVAP
jgi:hypothetical protein